MKELIERLEKEAPSRELDAEIASAVGWAPGPGYRRCSDNSWRMVMPGRTESDAINSVTWPPTYTGSIDDALTLVRSGAEFEVGSAYLLGVFWASVITPSASHVAKGARSPAIALCIAALKAREAANTSP